MAITSDGYDGQVGEDDAAEIAYGLGYGAAPSVVVTGWDVSVGVGTRALAISAGLGVATFVRGKTTTAETINAPANSSGSAVRSYVIVKFDWAANLTTFETKGTGVSLPSLTQTPGVTWEMPLATFTVANGAGVVSSVAVCKPRPRLVRETRLSLTLDEIFATSPGVTVGTVDLADPGWMYKVRVTAKARGRSKTGTPGGAFELNATANGAAFARSVSPALAPAGAVGVPCHLVDNSPSLTGPCTIAIVAGPNNLPAPGSFELYGGADLNRLIVEQFPV